MSDQTVYRFMAKYEQYVTSVLIGKKVVRIPFRNSIYITADTKVVDALKQHSMINIHFWFITNENLKLKQEQPTTRQGALSSANIGHVVPPPKAATLEDMITPGGGLKSTGMDSNETILQATEGSVENDLEMSDDTNELPKEAEIPEPPAKPIQTDYGESSYHELQSVYKQAFSKPAPRGMKKDEIVQALNEAQ